MPKRPVGREVLAGRGVAYVGEMCVRDSALATESFQQVLLLSQELGSTLALNFCRAILISGSS
jgi:hypothetical protein